MSDRSSQNTYPNKSQYDKYPILRQFTYLNNSTYSNLTEFIEKRTQPKQQLKKQHKIMQQTQTKNIQKQIQNIKVYYNPVIVTNQFLYQVQKQQQLPVLGGQTVNVNKYEQQFKQNIRREEQLQQKIRKQQQQQQKIKRQEQLLNQKLKQQQRQIQRIRAAQKQKQMIMERIRQIQLIQLQKLKKQPQTSQAIIQKQTDIFIQDIQLPIQQKQGQKQSIIQLNISQPIKNVELQIVITETVPIIDNNIYNQQPPTDATKIQQANNQTISPTVQLIEQVIIQHPKQTKLNIVQQNYPYEKGSIRSNIHQTGLYLLKIRDQYRNLKQSIKASQIYKQTYENIQQCHKQYIQPLQILQSQMPTIMTQAKFQLINNYSFLQRALFTGVISIGIGLGTLRMNRHRPVKSLLLMSRNTMLSFLICSFMAIPQFYYPFLTHNTNSSENSNNSSKKL